MSQRVAIYARVSTARQELEQTIESQIEALRQYVDDQGWTLEERHIYLDDGYSGARLARPGLDALRDAAAEGQFDLVLAYHPDRLARDCVWQQVVQAELERCGCQLQFLQRPISDKPEDRLLLQVQGMFAEYERAQIAERMRRGMDAQKAAAAGIRVLVRRGDGLGGVISMDRQGRIGIAYNTPRMARGWVDPKTLSLTVKVG